MSFQKLISKPNLLLAWRRITTTKDARYKQFFRHIYEAYELSYEANIKDLRRRLKDKEYAPNEPVRIYYPKRSGLQRPVTLLCIEDQILLQAIANIFAEKVREKRKPLIGKAIFSNWLTRKGNSEFFLSDWKFGYASLRRKLVEAFSQGYCWVADFDLSAFYETIPHDLLLKTIFPKGGSQEFVKEVSCWLKVWSSAERSAQHGHGIPQGPRAADFLAECIILPIDEQMAQKYSYLRYVDDIRILGMSEVEVRQALVDLDILCRERGLIPNSDKTDIKQIASSEELIAGMPDVRGYFDSGEKQSLDAETSERLVDESINKADGGIEITDRSKLRYTLFRAPASEKIMASVLGLWPRAPEHVDAIVVFLENYDRDDRVVHLCIDLLGKGYPYDFVRGEIWKLLARMATPREMQSLKDLAIDTIKKAKKGSASRIGAHAFLCRCESVGLGVYTKWLTWEEAAMIQAISAPYLTISLENGLEAVKQMLKRSVPDPALALTQNFSDAGLKIDQIGKSKDELSAIVQNVYHVAGILPGKPRFRSDPIGKILNQRYKVTKWSKWREILGSDYPHTHMILAHAEALFSAQFSAWLSHQDSFNDALFRGFQKLLDNKGGAGAIPTVDGKGHLINYGALLNNATFARAYPTLSGHLQAVHDRRNLLPSSHPYEKRTGAKAKPLRKAEQRNIAARLRAAYNEIIQTAVSLGV